MAVYKVIQDVESEDKLLGPLTFKGFVYMLIAGALAFINFRLLLATSLGAFRWPVILILAMPMLLFAVLASPLGREQPTEVWLLSRIRFLLQPRRRLWNQSGMKHLVTVTAPKKIERQLTKDLGQKDVSSRLRALAMTMDSRGWAVKGLKGSSERLTDGSYKQQGPLPADLNPSDDILDEQNNPTAKKFDQLMKQKDEERKRQITERIKTARHSREIIQQNLIRLPDNQPSTNPSEARKRAEKTIQPKTTALRQAQGLTAPDQPAKLELAQSGNDLSVDSIAKLANRPPKVEQVGSGEVVVKLH